MTALHIPRSSVVPLLLGLLLWACTPETRDTPVLKSDTVSEYASGVPKQVVTRRGDSVLERRTYRSTGMLLTRATADSVQTYFDLHNPDSAAVLEDYLHGPWRNLSADTSSRSASAFYIFDSDRLTFENPSRVPLETLEVTYKKNRTLRTESGMSVQPEIVSFDTARITGYTLVRDTQRNSLRE